MEIINKTYLVISFVISMLGWLVLLTYFFKKHSLLKRFGLYSPSTYTIAWGTSIIGPILTFFGLVDSNKPDTPSFGVVVSALILAACLVWYIIDRIIDWHTNLKES